jgi:hypothetical protein
MGKTARGGGEECDKAPSIIEAETSHAVGDNQGRSMRNWLVSIQSGRTSLGVRGRMCRQGEGMGERGGGQGGGNTTRLGNGGRCKGGSW